jgi:hypothetical protein
VTSTTTTQTPLKKLAGHGLLWLAQIAGTAALLTMPVWLLRLLSPAARPGSAIMLGPAILASAGIIITAVRASRARAAIMFTALPAAAAGLAALWPPPPSAWGALYAAAVLLRATGTRLSQPPPAARPGIPGLIVAFGAAIAVSHAASPSGSAAWSLQLVITSAPLMAVALTLLAAAGLIVGSRRSPLLERIAQSWQHRRLQRLARRGLRPLDPAAAPILYRRVDGTDGAWEWDVRDGQTTVARGHTRRRAHAERAANQACLRHTFRAPFARHPEAFYGLVEVKGNPFMRQVIDLKSALRSARTERSQNPERS